MRALRTILLLFLPLLLAAGCEYLPTWKAPSWVPGYGVEEPPPPPAAYAAHERTLAFSGERAFAHLEALVAIGPRPMGSEGAAAARDYIRSQIEALGLEVNERVATLERPPGWPFAGPPPPPGDEGEDEEAVEAAAEESDDLLRIVQLTTNVPGASEDLLAFAAQYDTRHFESFEFVGANDGASGAAVLLEMARVLAENPFPYTAHFLFLEGEDPGPPDSELPRFLGSGVIAREVVASGWKPHVRALVAFDRVCDADLRIARDLRSHRPARDEFWEAAARMGYGDAFRWDAPFETPGASHLPFVRLGFRRVVLLADTRFGGDEPPGTYAHSEDDIPAHCAPESLEIVGRVTLETLSELADSLAKIDRVSPPPPAPGSEEAEEEGEPVDAEAAEASGEDAAGEEGPATESEPDAEPDVWTDPEPEAGPGSGSDAGETGAAGEADPEP